MLTVKGIQLDFDITSPIDVARYKAAKEKAEAAADENNSHLETKSTAAPDFLDVYMEMLNVELRIYGNYIDDVFGDGVALQLLGSNPSLNTVFEIDEELCTALEEQNKQFGMRLQRYQPNRATRRKK